MKQHSDIELISYLRGSSRDREHAFRELHDRHGSRIYYYCRKVVNDDAMARDLFQETFMLLLRSVERGAEITNPPAYLLRIARNLCLKAREAKGREMNALEEMRLQPEEAGHNEEMYRVLESALELLSDEYREAIVLQMYQDLSYKEIAEITKVPVTTVRNRIARAKNRLREVLSGFLNEQYQDQG